MNVKKKRKKKYIVPKEKPRKKIYPTANAKLIDNMMISKKVKGKYKDHVVIVGNRLIDWLGSYDIVIKDGDELKKIGVNGTALIHKSKLHKIVGEAANMFWKCGVRTNIGVERRRDGCKAK